MNPNYSFIANSNIMILLAGLAIAFALVQSAIFYNVSYKRALELGFSKEDVVKVVKSSAIFSIIPSLPIILSYMILLPALGRFFPWLRLSVIGSAVYETMVADMAVTAYGYEGLAKANFTPDVYGAIMWVATLGIMLSGMTVFLLRSYDNKMKEITAREGGMGSLIGPIMFLSMMATFSAPYLIQVGNLVTMSTIIVSALSMILLEKISEKVSWLKEFAFSLSMIAGMAAASLTAYITGGL